MPTYIRVKQIDQDELNQFFIGSITSNSGQLINYINQNSINLTGENFISGNKTFNDNILVSGTGSFLELYLRSNINSDTGVRFIVTGDNFALLNRSGVKLRIDNIEASPYTGRNTIELNNTDTTLKFPSNKNDFIAVDSEIVHKTGNETISGYKSFKDLAAFSKLQLQEIDNLYLSGVRIEMVSGEIVLDSPIHASNLVYNTGNQNISGQKRFADEDLLQTFPAAPFGTFSQPSIFSAGHSGPGNYFFVPRPEYRSVVFPNPNYYYSGLNQPSGTEIYFNTGTSRWWYIYDNILQAASPVITAGQTVSFSARLPLNNWSGGNMRIRPVYSHNVSHYQDGADPIDPNLIRAVALTGDQTISGVKTFINNQIFSGDIRASGTGIFNALDLNNIDNLSLSGVDVTITSGIVILTDPISAPNLVYNTGNQTISGVKTFINSGIFNSGIDLNNSQLINAVPQFINETANFIISGNDNGRIILANSATQITGTIVSGNVTGFNTSIIQIGAGQIQITGAGEGVVINSFSNRFRTAGQYAQISLIHSGNNRYIMYGDTTT